jgi:hypothetical protein
MLPPIFQGGQLGDNYIVLNTVTLVVVEIDGHYLYDTLKEAEELAAKWEEMYGRR